MTAKRDTKERMAELGIEPKPVLKAVRLKCLECMGGSSMEVRQCPSVDCELWPFRFGRNPWRAERSERQKEVARDMGVRLKGKGR